MKALLIILALLAIAAPASAEWSRDDKSRQAIYTVLHLMDWSQTRNIAQRADKTEINPALGQFPTQNEVNRYFLGTLVLHYLVADLLPPKYRETFQYITIGVQASVVGHNYSAGVQFKF